MGVADLLASVANAPAEAEAADDTVESKPTESAPGVSSDDLAEKAVEGEQVEDADPKPEDPESEENQARRQADYTKKTQELAEERKRLHAEIESEREAMRAKEEDLEEFKSWIQSLRDPEQAEYQLMRYFGQTVQALKDKWLLEAQEESQLSERERAAIRRMREMEQRERERAEDEERARKSHEAQKKAQATNEFRKKLAGWLPEAAKAAGLDMDEDTYQLIKNELGNGKYWNGTWDLGVITKAAQVVAKALKKAPPPPPAKPAAPPSLKGPGTRGPGTKPAPKAAAKKDSRTYFEELRKKYGG